MFGLLKKVSNLEKQMSYLISNISKDKKYIGHDIEAGKKNTSKAQRDADSANDLGRENSKNIEEVSDGLMETFEETVRNATSVEELQDAIIELYEMIIEKEV